MERHPEPLGAASHLIHCGRFRCCVRHIIIFIHNSTFHPRPVGGNLNQHCPHPESIKTYLALVSAEASNLTDKCYMHSILHALQWYKTEHKQGKVAIPMSTAQRNGDIDTIHRLTFKARDTAPIYDWFLSSDDELHTWCTSSYLVVGSRGITERKHSFSVYTSMVSSIKITNMYTYTHRTCIRCYYSWGHFQLPHDPASKLTEHIVQ